MELIEEFCKGKSDAELDQLEADEKELERILHDGISEKNAVSFAEAMAAARKIQPEATVAGVIDRALSAGLRGLTAALSESESDSRFRKRAKAKPKTKRMPGSGNGSTLR